MSLNGLFNTQFPLTIDGTTSLDASSITIDGQNVNLAGLVPYTGANQTVDLGSQIIKSTHTATTNPELVNKGLLDTTISNLVVVIGGSFLDKVTLTSQSVVGPVTYTNTLTADDLVVPSTKKANLGGGMVEVDVNYQQSTNDASVTANQYFGAITNSLGIYQSTSTQDMGVLGLGPTLTVGQRYKVIINALINDTNSTNLVMYGSSNGTAFNQVLQSVSFSPNSTIFQVFTQTFTASYPYVILACFTSGPYVGATVQWFGLQRFEVGVELEKVTMPSLTADRVTVLNGNKQLVSSGISITKLNTLDNVQSDIQTQLNSKLNLSGSNANQDIVISGYKVQSSATPTTGNDYTNKTYVDGAISGAGSLYLLKSGGTMTGDITMGGNKVTSTANPATDDTLSRKGYVDTQDGLRLLKAGDTATGTILNSGGNFIAYRGGDTNKSCTLYANNSDGATYASHNGGLASWYGIGFTSTLDNITRFIFNTRDGNSSQTGTLTANAVNVDGQTASRVCVFDASKNLVSSSVTSTTLTYLDIGSSLSGLLNAKGNLSGGNTWSGNQTFSNIVTFSAYTAGRVLGLGASSNLVASVTTTGELSYVSGVTSSIQPQLDSKASTTYVDGQIATRVAKAGDTMTGTLGISGANVVEFGSGTAGKEGNAGKVGYGNFDASALCIVGAGTSSSDRRVRIWDRLGVGKLPRVDTVLDVEGNIVTNWGNYRIGCQYDTVTSGYYLGMATNSTSRFLYLISQSADAGGSGAVIIQTGATPTERVRWTHDGIMKFPDPVQSRIIVLYSGPYTDDHRFYGFGINGNTLRFNIPASSTDRFSFFAGAGSAGATSTEVFRINGTGGLESGVSGASANTIANLKMASSASHIDNTAGELYLFTGYNGHLGIQRNTTRNATTACLALGTADTEESEVVSYKADGSGYMPLSYAGYVHTWVSGNSTDTAVTSYTFRGQTGFDGSNFVNLQCQASQYGRNQLIMTGRYEGGNDAWSFAGGRNAIRFRTQSALNSAYTNRWTIQNFADKLGFLSAGGGDTPRVIFQDNGNVEVSGTISSPARIAITNGDPGDLISRRYGSADRYGIGQYSGGITRVFTSNTYAPAEIRFSLTTDDDTGGSASFTDLMTINHSGNVGIGTTNPSYKVHWYGNTNGGLEQYGQNANAGSSAYTLIGVRNNTPSQLVMFLNSSGRTADGGASTGTLRNDAGALRLQASGGNGINISSTDVNIQPRLTVGGDNSSGIVNIRNPNASFTHFGWTDNGNYIRGAFTEINTSTTIAIGANQNFLTLYANSNNSTEYINLRFSHNGNASYIQSYRPSGFWRAYLRFYTVNSAGGSIEMFQITDAGILSYGSFYTAGNAWCGDSTNLGNGCANFSQAWDRCLIYANGANTAGGYFYYNQGNAYGTISDRRIKKDFQRIEVSQSEAFLMAIEPTSFCLKDKECEVSEVSGVKPTVCSCRQDGWVAQNVLEACHVSGASKSVINKWADYEKEQSLPEEEQKTLIGVSDRPILSHTVNVVKGLMSRIATLEAREVMWEQHAREQEAKMKKMEASLEKVAGLLAQLMPK